MRGLQEPCPQSQRRWHAGPQKPTRHSHLPVSCAQGETLQEHLKLHLLPHQPGRQRHSPLRGSQWDVEGLHWHCFLQLGAHQPGSQWQAPLRGSQRPWGPHWQENWQSPPQWSGSQVQWPLTGWQRPLGWHGQLCLQSWPQYCSGQPAGGKDTARMGTSPAAPPSTQLALKGDGQGLSAAGTLTRTAVCSEEAGLAAAEPRFQAHLALPAGVLPLAHGCRGRKGTQHPLAPPSIPRETTIPLPPPSLRLSRGTISSFGGSPRGRTPLARLEQSCRAAPITERIRLDQRGDHALGFIPTHHSPTVHSLPSCFQPGQHARPAGNLRERPGGVSQGQGGFMASAKAKRSLPQC